MGKARDIIEGMRSEFGVRLAYKDESRLMKLIGRFLSVITLGSFTEFMSHYVTTLGNTIYVPRVWMVMQDDERAMILRHERIHLQQQRRYGRLLFSFLYLFPLLPVGLAYFRQKFEKEAYEEQMRAAVEYGRDIMRPEERNFVVSQFTSSRYLWMWPFKGAVRHWYDETARRLLSEKL